MTKLLFWGFIQVFAGIHKNDDNLSWQIHDQETLTCMLRTALLCATRGNNKTVIPFTLKQIDFSNYNEYEYTYYVKCFVEVDKHDYDIRSTHYQDLRDFYVTGIPLFDFQVGDESASNEFCLDT